MVSIFDFFKKDEVFHTERTVFGFDISKVDFSKKLPWADRIIDSPGIKISHIIMLWWLDKYHNTDRPIPQYFKKNYVDNFKKERKSLVKKQLLNTDFSLTDAGKAILEKHSHYIDLHRRGWVSTEEAKLNEEIYIQEKLSEIEQLKKSGDFDLAKYVEDELVTHDLIKKRLKAEELSKNGEIEASNKILLELKDNSPIQIQSKIYERLAINYRKLKDYGSEIKIIEEFLAKERNPYDGAWVDKSISRLNRAKELKDKEVLNKEDN